MHVEAPRIRVVRDAPLRSDGRYVLYWMVAFRRTDHNRSLARAQELSRELDVPVVVLEALRAGYAWASDRHHRFVIDGMQDNEAAFSSAGITYYPYVEPSRGAGAGLLAALAESASAVVTDDFPCFFLPRMLSAAASRLQVRLEAIDDNGLYPLADTERVFKRAVDFRRHLQRRLPAHLTRSPTQGLVGRPRAAIDPAISARWPRAELDRIDLGALPIDHCVGPGSLRGGRKAGLAHLDAFIEQRFDRYGDGRNDPDDDVASGLSPYLHFGHVAAREVFARIAARESWTPERLASTASGSRSGWWGMSPSAEAFLDQLITWRELGLNMCAHDPAYDRYESLPAWARDTLSRHAGDPRPHLYSLEQLERAETSDPIWNAAQRQLVTTGSMHNYLRMLWGKNVISWTPTPKAALETLIHLNNKYAVDGRNPNSYSGIFWVFGRYDRPWGPERPIFGRVRYMSSDNTRRKLKLQRYLERFGASTSAQRSLPL